LKLKALLSDRYTVAATTDGEGCPAEAFLCNGEAKQAASRQGLLVLLERVAQEGLANLSAKHSHFVDQKNGIYEFIKGDLRLLYFKGGGDVIVVCTSGVVKNGQKADKKAVAAAVELQKRFREAVDQGRLEWGDTGE